jgi:hypothetical protein
MPSLKPAADMMVPSWPFALTSTVAPRPMLTPLIAAMNVAVWVPTVPMRMRAVSVVVPTLPMWMLLLRVAVGTPVARRPPHRSQRALLTHWAPASGANVEAHSRPGMLNLGFG